ncbi:MAG: hypothetical protein WD770_06265 [Actinomycetota bacterium]
MADQTFNVTDTEEVLRRVFETPDLDELARAVRSPSTIEQSMGSSSISSPSKPGTSSRRCWESRSWDRFAQAYPWIRT